MGESASKRLYRLGAASEHLEERIEEQAEKITQDSVAAGRDAAVYHSAAEVCALLERITALLEELLAGCSPTAGGSALAEVARLLQVSEERAAEIAASVPWSVGELRIQCAAGWTPEDEG